MSYLQLTAAEVDPASLPVCPVCDNAMMTFDTLVVIAVDEHAALAHEDCVLGADEDEDEEDDADEEDED